MQSLQQIEEEIKVFIVQHYRISSNYLAFSTSVNLFEKGYVSSLEIANILDFLEGKFKIKIPDRLLRKNGFNTISGMARSVFSSLQEQGVL